MKFQRTSSNPDIIILQDGDTFPCSVHADVKPSWIEFLKHQLRSLMSLNSLWEQLIKLASGSSEPVVEQRQDRQGYRYYAIYDPRTGQRTICSSEAEVRAWLEQRYYH